ncbi:MAG TPA: ATP-binding protein [Polyangiaceae bacterium]|jgi:PAS domain S-box-containing protein|nr:ATP-binding protein [Polyangiaceae bacterium]
MSEGPRSENEELERLRAENWRLKHDLAEERERFEHVLESDLVGYLLSSFELNRFLDTNQLYCDFLGYDREEILASDPYQFWTATTFEDDRELERKQLERIVKGEISGYRLQKRHVTKSGELRWGEMSLSTVRDPRGRIRYNILSCIDIHEQKCASEASDELRSSLLQAQKLETVGRLVGGVAHDFNNRLLVIMGHADILKRGCVDDAALSSHAEIVVSSARRAADLTRQLLAYSRRQVLQPSAVDVNGVVERTRKMLERVLGERVELSTVLEAKRPMLADPGQLEQILMNLTLNARDAMPSGGHITLRTLDVDVSEAAPHDGLEPGAYVALEVTDTGGGIPESARAHIFEPFFTTKEAGAGTGLGLSTVDGIVRQSGGAIAVKTARGQGSTFTVFLPRASEPDAADDAPRTPAEHVPCRPELDTILVVDDDDDVRRLLVEVLRLGAYQVLEARDGDLALEIAEAHGEPIGLLVTDLVMPGLTGMELADSLRAHHPELKVLFMSGYAERERLRVLRENEQYLPKPFLPDELFRRVNDFMSEPLRDTVPGG